MVRIIKKLRELRILMKSSLINMADDPVAQFKIKNDIKNVINLDSDDEHE